MMSTAAIIVIVILAVALVASIVVSYILVKSTRDKAFEEGVEHRRQEAEAVLGSAEKEAQEKILDAERRVEEAKVKIQEAERTLQDAEKELRTELIPSVFARL